LIFPFKKSKHTTYRVLKINYSNTLSAININHCIDLFFSTVYLLAGQEKVSFRAGGIWSNTKTTIQSTDMIISGIIRTM
jgi:hypothetical protein